MNQENKGAFRDCKWCHGKGCLACPAERAKAEERAMQPIFTARYDNPSDMERFKKVFGVDALNKAFGPDGDGIREIEFNAAIQSIGQLLERQRSDPSPTAARAAEA